MKPMNEVAIVSATRTPIGKFGGMLKDMSPGKLGSLVVKDVIERISLLPREVDEVIMGNVLSGGQGMNVARQSAIWAGLPNETPAFAVNKVCGSGLKSVILGAQSILTGEQGIVVAGGTESMSTAMFGLDRARWGMKMGHGKVIDTMIQDGLWDVFKDIHMGSTAENIAEKYNVSRSDQDEFSVRSQAKAEKAIKSGAFKEEIVPVEIQIGKGKSEKFDTDEFPRFGTTKEALGKLKPAFNKDGTVTAGNSSGINDGAAAVVLMPKGKAKEKGIEPLATISNYASCALAPEVMGLGPVYAVRKVLTKAGMKIEDIDLIEVNEAFAAQSIAVDRELKWDASRTNVNGGAIALGHPIGASGARILVTLLFEMKHRGANTGIATLCIGGGQGIAMIVRRG